MKEKINLESIYIIGSRIRCFKTADNKLYLCLKDVFDSLGYTHGGSSPYISRMKKTIVLERDEVNSGIKNYAKFATVQTIVESLDGHCKKKIYAIFKDRMRLTLLSLFPPF